MGNSTSAQTVPQKDLGKPAEFAAEPEPASNDNQPALNDETQSSEKSFILFPTKSVNFNEVLGQGWH
jgi:hypothetical protein